jgi:hypothetical protein
MGAIACGGLGCLGAALGLGPFTEVSTLYLSGLVAPQRLLVSHGVHQGHGAGFVQLVQRVLAGSLVSALVVAPNFERSVLQVHGEDTLRAIDQKERGDSRGPARGGPEAPHDRW